MGSNEELAQNAALDFLSSIRERVQFNSEEGSPSWDSTVIRPFYVGFLQPPSFQSIYFDQEVAGVHSGQTGR